MFDTRHFVNTTTALLIIIVLTSAFVVPAVTEPTIAPKPGVTTTTAEPPTTTSTPNLPVTTSTQTPSTVNSVAVDQNPDMTFDLLPQNLSVTVGDTLAVTVAVENVTDMYAWQVCICFDSTVLQCTGVSLPSNNVFCNSVTASGFVNDYNATEFPNVPIQKVSNDEGWVLAYDGLLGANQTAFNGSGVLCQMEFKAVSPGSTVLKARADSAPFRTYIITSSLTTMTSESACCSYVYVE
jgi:hypothetical protein